GASPELLVAVSGNQVSSHPLAGTAPRSGNPVTDAKVAEELLSSAKNQIEHRIVIDMVRDTLLPWCSFLDWQAEPSIVPVANVQHLGTEISGQLSEPRGAARVSHELVICAFDSILRSQDFSAENKPEVVLRIGTPPASK
ncbi:MAG: chorismate-binding protein, partial [Actinomycetota bacterium]